MHSPFDDDALVIINNCEGDSEKLGYLDDSARSPGSLAERCYYSRADSCLYDSMRFRIYKSGALWIFVAIDMLIGKIPLATSNNWRILAYMAEKTSVNYRLQSLSHC